MGKVITGDEIHPYAKIVAVADPYDAMTSGRSYQDVREIDKVVEILLKCSNPKDYNIQLDRDCVNELKRYLVKNNILNSVKKGKKKELFVLNV